MTVLSVLCLQTAINPTLVNTMLSVRQDSTMIQVTENVLLVKKDYTVQEGRMQELSRLMVLKFRMKVLLISDLQCK